MLSWVKAFLEDRRGRVRINQSHGSYLPLKAGVPQGSVLAPILFLLFINNLPESLRTPGTYTFLFADDLAVVVEGNSVEECQDMAKILIRKVELWAQEWRMQLAPEKTTATLFTTASREANIELDLLLNGETVQTEISKISRCRAGQTFQLYGACQTAEEESNGHTSSANQNRWY